MIKKSTERSRNRYAYVGGNPISYRDPSGLYFGLDDLAFTAGGAAVGLAGQGLSDLFAGQLSGWEDYVGSALGGAAGGETLIYAGSIAAGAVGGLTTNLSKQGLRALTSKQCKFNWESAAVDTAIGGAIGAIPVARELGINAGRNSYNAIFKQMATKAQNGTASVGWAKRSVPTRIGCDVPMI